VTYTINCLFLASKGGHQTKPSVWLCCGGVVFPQTGTHVLQSCVHVASHTSMQFCVPFEGTQKYPGTPCLLVLTWRGNSFVLHNGMQALKVYYATWVLHVKRVQVCACHHLPMSNFCPFVAPHFKAVPQPSGSSSSVRHTHTRKHNPMAHATTQWGPN
jgi:hypothetical protein